MKLIHIHTNTQPKLIPTFINRVNDVKTGTLVGLDKYGNKYYEDDRSFFGESCVIKLGEYL